MITGLEHGRLGGGTVSVTRAGVSTGLHGALPLGLGDASTLAVGGLSAVGATVRGRAPGWAPLDQLSACGVRALCDVGHERLPFVTVAPVRRLESRAEA